MSKFVIGIVVIVVVSAIMSYFIIRSILKTKKKLAETKFKSVAELNRYLQYVDYKKDVKILSEQDDCLIVRIPKIKV